MPTKKNLQTSGAHGACLALLTVSCMLGAGESRVGQGELFTSGNPTYDAFFRDVHQQQLDEATWSDDKKGAHRALVSALELTADSADVTVVQAAHESASKVAKQPGSVRLVEAEGAAPHVVAPGGSGDAASQFFHALEETARQELDRAKRLRAVEPKLDALAKQESDLEARVKADFTKYGDGKESEVATELVATRDIVAKLKAHAEAAARESEDFVADLGRALETASEDKGARSETRRGRSGKKREDSALSATKAAPQSSDQATATPPPPPQRQTPAPPKPAETGEVFTP